MPDHLQPPTILTSQQFADLFGMSARWVEELRYTGTGPRYRRTGGRYSPVVYDLADIQEWYEAGKVRSTQEEMERER